MPRGPARTAPARSSSSAGAQRLETLRVLLRERPGARFVACLRVDVEQRAVRVGQHEHPLAVAVLMFHAVDLAYPLRARVLRENAQDASLLVPRARHLDARDVRGRRLVDDLR